MASARPGQAGGAQWGVRYRSRPAQRKALRRILRFILFTGEVFPHTRPRGVMICPERSAGSRPTRPIRPALEGHDVRLIRSD